jgi:hypothetical protein
MEDKIDLIPIEGFDGYFVNGDGTVYSTRQGVRKRVIPLKKPNGVMYVQLYRFGVKKQVHLHRVVAESFIHNPSNLKYVLFRDGDKENCHVENLYWSHNRKSIPKGKWMPVPMLKGVYMTKGGHVRIGDQVLETFKHSDGNLRVQIPGVGLKAVGLLHAITFPTVDKKKPKAKRKILSENQVSMIKAEYKPRKVTMNMLSAKYHISISAIRDIISGRSWAEVKPHAIAELELKVISIPQEAFILLKQWIPIKAKKNDFISIILYASKNAKGMSFKIEEKDDFVAIYRVDKK